MLNLRIYILLLIAFQNSICSDENKVETKEFEKLIKIIFEKKFKDCYKELVLSQASNRDLSKFFSIIDYIGKEKNDLGDEIECRKTFLNTTYGIINLYKSNLLVSENITVNFLDIRNFYLGTCLTDNCKEPLSKLHYAIITYQNNSHYTNYTKDIFYEGKEINKYNFNVILTFAFIVYFLFKILIGTLRLIFIPKGYEKHIAKILNDKGEMPGIINFDESIGLIPHDNENNSLDSSGISKKSNKNFDLEGYYPLYLKVMKFFDFYNDVKLFSTKKNKYFNDSGLESINLCRTIVLYNIVLYSRFTSLFDLPSKDILNQSFFSSNNIFIFRLSTHSIISWIALEGAYTSYKLMQLINSQMNEYYREEEMNPNKKFNFKLLFIYGKFILLFIPKIFIFILYYFCFYIYSLKFKYFFKAETTFDFIIKKLIEEPYSCSKNPNNIFYNFFTFNYSISSDDKVCYDFTFVYFNILFSTIVFMLALYIIFLFKNKIIEIIFFVVNMGLFFGLMLIIKDDRVKMPDSKEDILYNFYLFKGQKYTQKIAYLSLGVYHLGIIIGILCFNYNKIKTDQSNNIKINMDNNNYEFPYYPLSFLNNLLIWISKIKAKIRYIIILFFTLLIIFLSFLFKFSKELIKSQEGKDNDENIKALAKRFNKPLYFYFLFERHFFLILFFMINIIMITLPKKGFYGKLVKFKIITIISRTGFNIVCSYYIFGIFSFCTFLIKLNFNFHTFYFFSLGNFVMVFIFCFLINITFELPLRKAIKTLIRFNKKWIQ